MRKSVVLLFLPLLFACGDGNLVQPQGEMSIDVESSELSVAAKSSGVQRVPFKAHGYMDSSIGGEGPTEEEIAACIAAGGVSVDAAVMPINVTHMGKAKYRFWDCWSADFGILFYHGKVVAANGDELYFSGPEGGEWETFEVDWTADPIPWTFASMAITGGTGRFENATGSFVAWGWSAYDPDRGWYGEENWEGWISSVGSSK